MVSTNIVSNNNNDGSIIFSIPSPLTSSNDWSVPKFIQTIPSEENGDYYNEGFGITLIKMDRGVTFKTPNGRDKEEEEVLSSNRERN